ncbi:MAG: hypothetical protein AAFN74_00520, partial [Myxococcota bacterium]
SRTILDAVTDLVAVVKFQSAYFELLGGAGVTLMAQLAARAKYADWNLTTATRSVTASRMVRLNVSTRTKGVASGRKVGGISAKEGSIPTVME